MMPYGPFRYALDRRKPGRRGKAAQRSTFGPQGKKRK